MWIGFCCLHRMECVLAMAEPMVEPSLLKPQMLIIIEIDSSFWQIFGLQIATSQSFWNIHSWCWFDVWQLFVAGLCYQWVYSMVSMLMNCDDAGLAWMWLLMLVRIWWWKRWWSVSALAWWNRNDNPLMNDFLFDFSIVVLRNNIQLLIASILLQNKFTESENKPSIIFHYLSELKRLYQVIGMVS